MTGDAELDAMIARIRKVPALGRLAAPEVALVVEEEIKRTIAAGETPDGAAWAPRKVDGGRALEHAAKAVHCAAIGSIVFVRLTGIEARHHAGRIRGRVKRQVIPTDSIPASMAARIRAAITKTFAAEVGNG